MTPWQLSVVAGSAWDQRHKASAWLAWHTAALTRVKKMPKLKDLLGKPKVQAKGIDEVGVAAALDRLRKTKQEV